jgi:hypothetical protein
MIGPVTYRSTLTAFLKVLFIARSDGDAWLQEEGSKTRLPVPEPLFSREAKATASAGPITQQVAQTIAYTELRPTTPRVSDAT